MTIPVFQFYPTINAPSAISNSYPAVVALFLTMNYVVGQVISFRCPPAWGMTQINGKSAKILAVNPVANTITIDLDTSTFNPFVVPGGFPLTWTSYALTVPAGEIGTLAAAIRDNTTRPGYVRV